MLRKRRGLERSLILLGFRDVIPAEVFLHRPDLGHTKVVKVVVGEIGAVVAEDTARLALEESHASHGGLIHRLLIARDVFVEGRVGGNDRAFVSRDRLGDALAGSRPFRTPRGTVASSL
jgi:hypothetical protein